MTRADLVLHPDFLVPIRPREVVLEHISVAVKDGCISALIPRADARAIDAKIHRDLPGQVLLPGLVNAHGHAAMTLLRGFADDLPLMAWLQQYIWPMESAFVSEEFVADGSRLALAELILGGTTTFSDNYFFPDITAHCADLAGIRAQLVFPILDIQTAWAQDAERYLEKGLALRDQYRHHDRIEIGFGPHSTYSVDEPLLQRIGTYVLELDAPLQIHLHETREEVLMSVERCGERPLDQLARLGLLSPRTQCVHMTDIGQQDIETVAHHGASVIHCPRSNMKLGSGACPVQTLLDSGVTVGLGTDGAASNNRLNMITELQTAALLAKVSSGSPTALSATDALDMATMGGAKALGLDHLIGSIEVGKQADMIALDLSHASLQPLNNVISHIVYATSGTEVRSSWVAGQNILNEGVLSTLDIERITENSSRWRQQLSEFRSTL